MALLEQWREIAYNDSADKNKLQQLWTAYFQEEKGIYEQLLKNPDEVVKGTVKELAEKYGVSIMTMTDFWTVLTRVLWKQTPSRRWRRIP